LPTATSIADDAAWSSLVTNQLSDARKTAENWRNGLATLIGLIATISVVKGPSDLGGLEPWAAYAVGVLLGLGLACAVFGGWKALVAAYGEPSVMTLNQYRALGGIGGVNLKRGEATISNLRWAQRATIASVIFVASAVGLTWYGPRPASSATLSIDRWSLPAVCGKLASAKDGNIDLQPSGAPAVRVPTSDVMAMKVVTQCP
jgi:hypothetical protein